MKQLPILWRRLVSEQGGTCPRCESTGLAVEQAVDQLRQALEPLGVQPSLRVEAISEREFVQSPLRSNEILIGGQALEHWLGARTGSSPCCDECGDKECRTVELDGEVHEALPVDLLLRAGMIAASRMLDPTLEASNPASSGS